jgi:hypothetical protein
MVLTLSTISRQTMREGTMKRLVTLLFMFSVSPALAVDDPTFNGMAKLLHCSIAHRAICAGEYCSDFSMSVGWNNIWIDFQNRLIGSQAPLNSRNSIPIRIIEVSEAGLNKILFEKLEYDDTQTKQMLINYYPGQGQMMSVRFGIVSRPKSGELTKGFTVEKLVEIGECEIQ